MPTIEPAPLLAFMAELEAIVTYLQSATEEQEHRRAKSVAYGYASERLFAVLQEAGIPREMVADAVRQGRENPGWERFPRKEATPDAQ